MRSEGLIERTEVQTLRVALARLAAELTWLATAPVDITVTARKNVLVSWLPVLVSCSPRITAYSSRPPLL
jgi:hypothetical protein